MRPSLEERFWKFVDKKEGCWMWTGAIHSNGYGKFSVKTSSWENAHRVCYRIMNGEIQDGLVVRHKCDVRLCVNPEHLELGTKKDNTQDMMIRGRNKYKPQSMPGEKNPMSKLSDKQRDEIKSLLSSGIPRKIIASQYQVSRQTIDNLAKIESQK